MYPYLAYRNARESMKCIYLFQERLRGLRSNPRNTIIHSSFPLFPLVYIVIRKSFVCRQLFLQIFPPACEICTRTFTELRLFPIAFIPRKVQMHPSFARRHEIHSSLLCFFPFFSLRLSTTLPKYRFVSSSFISYFRSPFFDFTFNIPGISLDVHVS